MTRIDDLRTLPELLGDHAIALPDKVAFTDAERTITYTALAARTGHLAGHLAALGLARGDRVMILLGNRVETVESYLAVTRAAGVGVPVNPRSSDAELAYLVDDSGSRVLITDRIHLDQATLLRATRPELILLLVRDGDDHPAGMLDYEELARTEPDRGPRDDLGLGDPAWLLYTSGTTGKPKGVLSSQAACLWSVRSSYQSVLGLERDDRLLWPLPLFHSLAHILCVLGVTATGASARILPGFGARDVLDALRVEPFTLLTGVPSMYFSLLDSVRETGLVLPRLRACLVTGAVTGAELSEAVQTVFGVPMVDSYGSTETCGAITMSHPGRPGVPGYCGQVVPGTELRLTDPRTGYAVLPGAEGEVLVRSPSLMLGYHQRPRESADALAAGWYRTGDLARQDDEGRLMITGRVKELIIRAGENIHPGEIEAVLRDVPGVAEAAVTGRHDEALGEVPVGYLVPAASGWSARDALAACRERLSYFKVPAELHEIGELPRTSTGKVSRRALPGAAARLRGVGTGRHENLWRTRWVPWRTEAAAPAPRAGHWLIIGAPRPGFAAAVRAAGGTVTLVGEPAAAAAHGPVDGFLVATTDLVPPGTSWEESSHLVLDRLRASGVAALSGHGVLLSEAAVATERTETTATDGAAIRAWCRAARGGNMTLIDLEHGEPEPAVWAELQAGIGTEPEFAIRGGAVFVPRIGRVPASTETTAPPLDPAGTVLVTGADRAIAATLAGQVAGAHGVGHLVLAPSGAGTEDLDSTRALATRLSGERTTVTVVADADLSTGEGVAMLLDHAGSGPPLTAILHQVSSPADAAATALLCARLPKLPGVTLSVCTTLDDPLGVADRPADAAAVAAATALARRTPNVRVLGFGPLTGTEAAVPGVPELSENEVTTAFDGAADAAEEDRLLILRSTPWTLRGKGTGRLRALLRTTGEQREAGGDPGELRAQLSGLPGRSRLRTLTRLVCDEAAALLGQGEPGPVAADVAFTDLGLTSATAVALRDRLAARTGLALPATLAFDNPTSSAIARFLDSALCGEQDSGAEGPVDLAASSAADKDDPIAIVGMGCRYPGGVDSPEDLWRLVAGGTDAITAFPGDRGWDLERLLGGDGTQAGTSLTGSGGFLGGAGDFDAAFFGVSPREALAMDPQQRLLLEIGWEAIERAGIDPRSLRGTDTGVYTGLMFHDYAAEPGVLSEELERLLGTGNAGSVASGRIAYTLGLTGPAVTVDTACSSSLVAIHLAVQSLRRGECSLALAGGVAVLATPATFIEFSRQRGLAPDGRCKSFAAAANGTGWAEGAGLVVLERLSEAKRKGHRVLAVLRGSAMNQDGASNGLTAPSGPAQQRVIHRALTDSGLRPSDVDAVEAHGTGTVLGDPIEVGALLATYGRDRPPERPLLLGSLKSNIGHTQSAAGVAGVIKMVQAIQHGEIPRTLHVDQPTSAVDWASGSVRLALEHTRWPETGRPRRAAVSSFGVSGTNAHLVLEQAPEVPSSTVETTADTSVPLPILLSARTADAVPAQAKRLLERVRTDRELEPAALATALATTRSTFEHRAGFLVTGRAELLRELALVADPAPAGPALSGRAGTGGLAIGFTGQGSQFPGMGRELHATFPVFADALELAAGELDRHLCRPLLEVMWADEDGETAALLDRTDFTQAALFAIESALFRLVESWGVLPELLLGHSVGELTAAHVAGVLSLPDAATLVAARGRLMAALPSGGAMVSLEATEDEVRAELDTGADVSVAAVNGPMAVVLSGEDESVRRIAVRFTDRGRRAKQLRVSHAFHSVRMEPMLAEFGRIAAGLTFHSPNIPVLSNLTGRVAEPVELCSPGYWMRHVRGTVRFADGVRALPGAGISTFLELGPGGVLVAMARESVSDADLASFASLREKRSEAHTLLTAVTGVHVRGTEVDWAALFRAHPAVPAMPVPAVELPTYPFQHRRYWLGSVPRPSGPGFYGLDPVEHPLLSAAISLPDGAGHVLSGQISAGTCPWLEDHLLDGEILLPETVFLELAAQGAAATGCAGPSELTVQAPLVFGAGDAVQVQVGVSGPEESGGARTVTVRSRAAAGESWVTHAHAMLPAAEPDPARVTWPSTEDGSAEPVDLDGLYHRMADTGLVCGPSTRCLASAWRHGQEVLAELRLTEADRADAARYGLHPLLLTAALHTAAFIGSGGPRSEEQGIRLAHHWTGIALRATGHTTLRARISPAGRDAVRIDFFDEHGGQLGGIGSVRTHVVTADRLRPRVRVGGSLWHTEWHPRPATAPATENTTERRLVLDLRRHNGSAVGPGTVLTSVRDTLHQAGARLRHCLAGDAGTDPCGTGLVVLTRRAVAVDRAATAPDPVASAVWHLASAAQAAHPGRIVLADLDTAGDLDTDLVPLEGAPPELRATLLAAENEPRIAVRSGTTHVARLVRGPAAPLPDEPPFGGGAVLVTSAASEPGVLVATDLAERGVRHLVLLDENTGTGLVELRDTLTRSGVRVDLAEGNPTDRRSLAGALAGVRLSAVVHLPETGTSTVTDHTAEAAWNLHLLTKGHDLTDLVLCLPDEETTGRHGADPVPAALVHALAGYRHSLGLPATCLMLRRWATERHGTPEPGGSEPPGEHGGFQRLTTADGLSLLYNATMAGSGNRFGPAVLLARPHIPVLRELARENRLDPLLSGMIGPPPAREQATQDVPVTEAGTTGDADAADSWRQRLRALAPEQREQTMVELVREQIAEVAGFGGAHEVDPARGMTELGLDSVSAVEVRDRIGRHLGHTLPATLAFDHPSALAMGRFLAIDLFREAGRSGEAPLLDELIRLTGRIEREGVPGALGEQFADRLRALSARLSGPLADTDHEQAGVSERIGSSSTDDLFDLIDNELMGT